MLREQSYSNDPLANPLSLSDSTPPLAKRMRFFDNTMLCAYKACPRRYYLRHVRGWRASGPPAAPAFGLAWHAAMNQVWLGISSGISEEECFDRAFSAFLDSWREQGMPESPTLEEQDNLGSRIPATAAEMIRSYIGQYAQLIRRADLLSVEQPFAVPLHPDRDDVWYVGRRDKDIRIAGSRVVVEHKTTSMYKKDGGFRASWVESWFPNAQCEGYLFSLLWEDGEAMHQVWIDAALVHRTQRAFRIIPVSVSPDHLDAWLLDTRDWVSRIQQELARLAEGAFAFPKNTDSCFSPYGACQFLEICRASADPPDEPPPGYVIEHWEPFDLLGLSKLGLGERDG